MFRNIAKFPGKHVLMNLVAFLRIPEILETDLSGNSIPSQDEGTD